MSIQQSLTILSFYDGDQVCLTETAQVIEVSTVAIHHAIREYKDDKLFYCLNQFSTILTASRLMVEIVHLSS